MTARVRRRSVKTTIAATYASTGVVLLALTLLVAFLLEPPLLGWVGFAVVCAILLSLATVATIAFPRMRVNPQRPAVALDHQSRLLVVADEHCGSPALWQEIYARLNGGRGPSRGPGTRFAPALLDE
jgi:Na+/melibiose symporter-like transporter